MEPVKIIIAIIAVCLWLYLLRVFRRAEMKAWHFGAGALGLFAILMVAAVPYLTQPLARSVAAIAGLFGNLTGWFAPYFRYGIIFIRSGSESVSMLIDFECSGIIEILAFECLLVFFDVYSRYEKVIVGLGGFLAITLLNAARIVLIAAIVHFAGTGAFYVAHTFIGRIFFYVFTVILYFFVFTRPQVIRMKVGHIRYGRFKRDA